MKGTYNLVLVCLLVSSAVLAQTDDWLVAIGGNSARNGATNHYGPLVVPGEEPELYWSGGEYAKYAGHPVIEGDKLVLYRRWASASQTESWIVCYNVYDGTELWKVTLPADPGSDRYGKVSAVNGGQVYASRAGGHYEPSHLFALDINTGAILWESQDDVTEYRSETVVFTENGDIVAGNKNEILCIDKDNGNTLWTLDRHTWDDAGASVTAFGNLGYYWDKVPETLDLVISVCDLNTGTHLFYSEAISTAGMQAQQTPITVGMDGTVYSTRSNSVPDFDYITSFTNMGDHFVENWSYPTAWVTFGNHGVAPDGTVYTYSRDNEIVRLDPADGTVLNTSIPIAIGNNVSPAIAFGADGIVYFTSEHYPTFELFMFTPELEVLWSEVINGVRGVALGDSVMAICGKGTIVRAYKGRSFTGIADSGINPVPLNLSAFPNPAAGQTMLSFTMAETGDAMLEIFDLTGRTVYREELQYLCQGENSLSWNGRSQNGTSVESGVYMARLTTGSFAEASTSIVIIR